MGRFETEAVIEAVGVIAGAVGGELHKAAATGAAFGDGPVKELLTEAETAGGFMDADGFDLTAPQTLARQAGDEGELQDANHCRVVFDHGEELIGVTVDGLKRREIDRIGRGTSGFARRPKRIIGEHINDGLQVGAGGAPNGDVVGHGL